MQRIYPCSLTPEEYTKSSTSRKIVPERGCPRCGWRGRLHRHGSYERGITTSAGLVIRIMVARFLCLACGGTVSYLPDFALSYRLLQAPTFEAFLDGKLDRLDVRRWSDLLHQYDRRMLGYRSELLRALGNGLGCGPPSPPALWPYLKEACGGLAPATRRLVTQFKITLFGRYQCHQPVTTN